MKDHHYLAALESEPKKRTQKGIKRSVYLKLANCWEILRESKAEMLLADFKSQPSELFISIRLGTITNKDLIGGGE